MTRNKERPEPDSIVVGAAGLTNVDATVLRFLLGLKAYAIQSGCSGIRLVGATSELEHLLETTGLSREFIFGAETS